MNSLKKLVSDRFCTHKLVGYFDRVIRIFYKRELSALAELFGGLQKSAFPGQDFSHELLGLSDMLCLEHIHLPEGDWGNCFFEKRTFQLAVSVSICSSSLAFMMPFAEALPTGYQSVVGNVQFQQSGNTLNVSTQANRSIANYQTFNVAQNETVNFNLPSAQSAILNRVVGPNSPSEILGHMNANGQVFIVNPSGIIFGQSAQINVGSITASTLNITDQNFENGQMTFDQSGNSAAVVNQGSITAASGGSVNLFGGAVQNAGSINAPNGSVNMAVGQEITMNISNGLTVEVTVDQSLKQAVSGMDTAIANTGSITAQNGVIEAQTNLANHLYSLAINNTGIMQAQGFDMQNGEIFLSDTPGSGATVANSGTLDVSGQQNTTGGTVKVLGDTVTLNPGSVINASGDTGGGTVLVGGDFHGEGPDSSANVTFMASGASILANAITSGNGGQVALWSNELTGFYGDIQAHGGSVSGNGGYIEVSSHGDVGFNGSIDLSAPQGTQGSLLLDPTNIIVDNSGSASYTTVDSFSSGSGTETVSASALEAVNGNVTLQATGNITFNSGSDITLTGSQQALIAQANENITVNDNITTNAGDILMTAGNNVTVNGTLSAGSGNIGITSSGSGNLSGSGLLSGSTVSLSTDGGNVGNNQTPMNVNASTLVLSTGNTSGNATVNDDYSGTITLSTNNTVAGNLLVTDTGANSTLNNYGEWNSQNVTFYSNSTGVSIINDTEITASNNVEILTTGDSSRSLNQNLITAGGDVTISSSGNNGTAWNFFGIINANNVSLLANASGGNAWNFLGRINASNNVTMSSAADTWNLAGEITGANVLLSASGTSAGAWNTGGNINATNNVTLLVTGNNGWASNSSNITATNVMILATGANATAQNNNISGGQGTTGTITAANVVLSATGSGGSAQNFTDSTINAVNGHVTLQSDTMSNQGTINTGQGTIQLEGDTTASTIALGNTTGALQLTEADFSSGTMTAGQLVIGSTGQTGNINVSSFNMGNIGLAMNLSLQTTNLIHADSSSPNLTLMANQSLIINGGNGIGSNQVATASNPLKVVVSGTGSIDVTTYNADSFINSSGIIHFTRNTPPPVTPSISNDTAGIQQMNYLLDGELTGRDYLVPTYIENRLATSTSINESDPLVVNVNLLQTQFEISPQGVPTIILFPSVSDSLNQDTFSLNLLAKPKIKTSQTFNLQLSSNN